MLALDLFGRKCWHRHEMRWYKLSQSMFQCFNIRSDFIFFSFDNSPILYRILHIIGSMLEISCIARLTQIDLCLISLVLAKSLVKLLSIISYCYDEKTSCIGIQGTSMSDFLLGEQMLDISDTVITCPSVWFVYCQEHMIMMN